MTQATGPLKHVVLFRFKEGTPQATIDHLVDEYRALPTKIETMKHFEWGVDVSVENRNEGFTHCFITTFDNPAGLEIYLPHPAHVAYVEELKPHLDGLLVVDFHPQP